LRRDTEQEVRIVSGQVPEQFGSEQVEPRCARCGGELLESAGRHLPVLVGMVLLLAGFATCLLAPFSGRQALLAPGAAAVILGTMLARRRIWWRCTSCGMRYRRRLPPRGFLGENGRIREERLRKG